jgi:large subunit ribosomal protein L18
MDSSIKTKIRQQQKRVFRVRKGVRGTSEKPRMCVVRSNFHIYIQLIDDTLGRTLASISTLSKSFKGTENGKKSSEAAKALGLAIAEMAQKQKIESVVFDRGKRKYHGLVANVADGAREGGLRF